MTVLLKREGDPHEATVFDPLEHTYENWAQPIRTRWPEMFPRRSNAVQLIPVDEYRHHGVTVVRAELPGIDPAKDVQISVAGGLLRIKAERREDSTAEEKIYIRREIRSGSLLRVLPMPQGVSESDVSATYSDGILEVRVTAPEPVAGTA